MTDVTDWSILEEMTLAQLEKELEKRRKKLDEITKQKYQLIGRIQFTEQLIKREEQQLGKTNK